MDSLAVLTGVDSLRSIVTAPPDRRPTWIAPDLSLLLDPARADFARSLTDRVQLLWAQIDGGTSPDALTDDITALSA